MKKVAELEGAELDYWVVKAFGFDKCPASHATSFLHPEYCFQHKKGITEKYSSNWANGGPLIDKYQINIDEDPVDLRRRYASLKYNNKWYFGIGNTTLEAVCRAIVSSKFGEEVPEIGDE